MFDFAGETTKDIQKLLRPGTPPGYVVLKVDKDYYEKVKKNLVAHWSKEKNEKLKISISKLDNLKSLNQVKFIWSIYQLIADITNGGSIGEGMTKREDLYNDDIKSFSKSVGPFTIAEEDLFFFRDKYKIYDENIIDVGAGKVSIIVFNSLSSFTKKQAMEWIDMLLQRLAEMDIPPNLESKALLKWQEFQLFANNENWQRLEGKEISQEKYKEYVKSCEMCGKAIYENGSLAHIVARGMGGNQEKWKESPENWLHLHDTCHYYLDNGPGLKQVLTENPHLKGKIDKAHTLGAKQEIK